MSRLGAFVTTPQTTSFTQSAAQARGGFAAVGLFNWAARTNQRAYQRDGPQPFNAAIYNVTGRPFGADEWYQLLAPGDVPPFPYTDTFGFEAAPKNFWRFLNYRYFVILLGETTTSTDPADAIPAYQPFFNNTAFMAVLRDWVYTLGGRLVICGETGPVFRLDTDPGGIFVPWGGQGGVISQDKDVLNQWLSTFMGSTMSLGSGFYVSDFYLPTSGQGVSPWTFYDVGTPTHLTPSTVAGTTLHPISTTWKGAFSAAVHGGVPLYTSGAVPGWFHFSAPGGNGQLANSTLTFINHTSEGPVTQYYVAMTVGSALPSGTAVVNYDPMGTTPLVIPDGYTILRLADDPSPITFSSQLFPGQYFIFTPTQLTSLLANGMINPADDSGLDVFCWFPTGGNMGPDAGDPNGSFRGDIMCPYPKDPTAATFASVCAIEKLGHGYLILSGDSDVYGNQFSGTPVEVTNTDFFYNLFFAPDKQLDDIIAGV